MCSITEKASIFGSAKGKEWFSVDTANVYFDHPYHAPLTTASTSTSSTSPKAPPGASPLRSAPSPRGSSWPRSSQHSRPGKRPTKN
jgi:hypothetical protein